jgi:hypothetical protein
MVVQKGGRFHVGASVVTNDIFVELIKFEVLCSRRTSEGDFRRLRAAAVLAYCAGLWFTEILALRRRHWMPDGQACIRIEGNSQRPPRKVPASPAVVWAVRQLTGPSSAPAPDALIFGDGMSLTNGIQRALRRLDLENATVRGAGDLRASFEDRVMRVYRDDPLAFYLVGAAATADVPPVPSDPPLKRLDGMLRRSGILYKHDDLWSASKPQGEPIRGG